MPLRVYLSFLGRLTLESREYVVLKTAVIESNASSNVTVEICDNPDALLLLKRATEFYPEGW
ncbi:MAG: hypothetical protein ACTHMB_00660 [Candidatus Binatia bacterium]